MLLDTDPHASVRIRDPALVPLLYPALTFRLSCHLIYESLQGNRHPTHGSTMSPGSTFKPNESRFAVVRIDPVASVAHLSDSEATEAAKALESKCYLVYITAVRLPVLSVKVRVV